jgi:hypothetical protein
VAFFYFVVLRRNNHQSSKLNISSHEQQIESEGEIEDEDSINIYSKEQNPILFENDEPISDDEQVRKFKFQVYCVASCMSKLILFCDSSRRDNQVLQ